MTAAAARTVPWAAASAATLTWFCCAVMTPAAGAAGDASLLWALFRNGDVVSVENTPDPWAGGAAAELSGRRLLDDANPLRLLRNQGVIPQLRGPHLVMFNGDVLPGQVVGFGPADPAANLPDHLTVVLAPGMSSAQRAQRRAARMLPGVRGPGNWDGSRRHEDQYEMLVRADCVRFILFKGHATGIAAGTLSLADGRGAAFSSLRWTDDGVKILGEEGASAFGWSALAAVHLTARDNMSGALADAAAPATDERFILRATLGNGAELTFRAWALLQKQKGVQATWAVKPAWALDAIFIESEMMSHLNVRPPTELPLSLLGAQALAQEGFMGFTWAWRRNRSVRGTILQSGSMQADLGIGSHSFSRVAFELPPGAQNFQTWVGLDRNAGDGGCAVARIHRDQDAKPLWSSGFIRGGQEPVKTGAIDIRSARRLVLVTDYGHEGRPADADPWDIRDEMDWLLPTVSIDAKSLPSPASMVRRHLPALEEWVTVDESFNRLGLACRWDPASRRFYVTLRPENGGLLLKRRLPAPRCPWALDVAAGWGDKQAAAVEVLVNGSPPATTQGILSQRRYEVAPGRAGDRWLFAPTHNGEIELQVRIGPDPKALPNSPIVLRGLAVRPAVEGLELDQEMPVPKLWLSSLEPAAPVLDKKVKVTRGNGDRSVELDGLKFSRFVMVENCTTLVYAVPAGHRRFVAVLNALGGANGEIAILFDDQAVRKLAGRNHRPRLIDVVLPEGARQMTLRMPPGASVVWANAGFLPQ